MKAKVLSILTAIILLISFATGQISTMGYAFQGYALDPEGKALGQEDIKVRFTISNISGTGGYSVVHDLQTDVFGVFTATIGSINPVDFGNIDYREIKYLKVEVKKTAGGIYTTISEGQMQSVPYAQYANNGVPKGTIIAFAGDKNNITNGVPSGWLLCDGASVAISSYPGLYAMIGNSWGGTAASFNLPDLRGRFLRGVDDGAGNDPDALNRTEIKPGGNTGDAVGSLQTDMLKSHDHTGFTGPGGAHDHRTNPNLSGGFVQSGGGATPLGWDGTDSGGEISLVYPVPYQAEGDHTHGTNASGGNETRPTNASVYYIIKY